MTFRIAFCGAHGTGKTTLLNLLKQEVDVPVIERTIRNYWESVGVNDFNPLPAEVRAEFQKYLLLNQIRVEDDAKHGFLTDRSVLDYIGYTVMHSSMSQLDLQMFEQLLIARLQNYTHLIYLPVEFESQDEYLRASSDSQQDVGKVIESRLFKWLEPQQYLIARGSVEERMTQIRNYLGLVG